MNARFRSKRVRSPKGEGCFSSWSKDCVSLSLLLPSVDTLSVLKGGPIPAQGVVTLIATT